MRDYQFHVDWWNNVSNNFIDGPGFMKQFVGVPTRAIQIGCFEGMGTVWLLDNVLTHEDSTLIDIDTFSSNTDLSGADFEEVKRLYYHNLKECPGSNKHKLIIGKSQDILQTLEENSFDLIYVDGSHLRDDVWFDAIYSDKLLKIGGLIFFDDYEWSTDKIGLPREYMPHDAIDRFINEYKNNYSVVDIHYQAILKKIK